MPASTWAIKMKKPPKLTPARQASPKSRCSRTFPGIEAWDTSQIPPKARINPASRGVVGVPAVKIPKPTGNTAPITAAVGATIAVLPSDRARYKAAIPSAPHMPASMAQILLRSEGSASCHNPAKTSSTTIPERVDKASTWNWCVRRVARPPLKSPLPQISAEVNARNTPSRFAGRSISPNYITFGPVS